MSETLFDVWKTGRLGCQVDRQVESRTDFVRRLTTWTTSSDEHLLQIFLPELGYDALLVSFQQCLLVKPPGVN